MKGKERKIKERKKRQKKRKKEQKRKKQKKFSDYPIKNGHFLLLVTLIEYDISSLSFFTICNYLFCIFVS